MKANAGTESLQDFLTTAGAVFADAWLWMLGAGILHTTYHQVPAVGYWTAVIVSVFFGGANAGRSNILRRLRYLTGEKKP
jgi:hypothetical protein